MRDVPEGRGAWATLFAAIYRRTRVRERVRARPAPHRSSASSQAAAAIPDGVVVLDARSRIDWANPRALAQLGLDLAHDRGQPIVNLVRQPEFLRYVGSGRLRGVDRRVVGPRCRAAGWRCSSCRSAPTRSCCCRATSPSSKPSRGCAATSSPTCRTSSRRRSPCISGFVETLQDLDVDERQRKRFLQLMQEQAKNMQRLVADLLTLSALESDQNPSHDEPFAVVPLLLALSADAKGLSQGAAPGRARHRRSGDGARQPRRARERVRQSRQQRRSAIRLPAARSRSRGASTTTAPACSPSRTRASASPPNTCRA